MIDETRAYETACWLEDVAEGLYEAGRVAHPERPPYAEADRTQRADARYRAQGAHQRSDPSVKAVLVERIAQTLALADGFIWPSCEARTRQIMSELEYAATVAQRRQAYRHKARLVITTHDSYLDVHAVGQPVEHRAAILAAAQAQQDRDVETVKAWRRSVGQVVDSRALDGAVTGDGRN